MCLNKQDSEYTLGPKYAKLLKKFWISQGSHYVSFTQFSEYDLSSEYILGPTYAKNLNMAGFWICNSYTKF